jgi:hypothetical protein
MFMISHISKVGYNLNFLLPLFEKLNFHMHHEHIVFYHSTNSKVFQDCFKNFFFSKDDDCISKTDVITKSTQVGI